MLIHQRPWKRQPQLYTALNQEHWLAKYVAFAALPGVLPVPHTLSAAANSLGRLPAKFSGTAVKSPNRSGVGRESTSSGTPELSWQDAAGNAIAADIPAGSDWTTFCLIDNVGGGGSNPGIWRSGGGTGVTFVIQSGSTNRVRVRLNSVDILNPGSGPAWTTGQTLALLVTCKSAGQIDVYWDGALQHTATHATATPAMTGANGITNWGWQTSTSEYTTGTWQQIVLLHKYLTGPEAVSFLANTWQLFAPIPRRIWTPASAGTTATVTSAGAIASAEAFGTATVTHVQAVSCTGIASAEAFGSPTLSLHAAVSPGGIASAEALGVPIATHKHAITCTGIASAEAFGNAVVTSDLVAAGGRRQGKLSIGISISLS